MTKFKKKNVAWQNTAYLLTAGVSNSWEGRKDNKAVPRPRSVRRTPGNLFLETVSEQNNIETGFLKPGVKFYGRC